MTKLREFDAALPRPDDPGRASSIEDPFAGEAAPYTPAEVAAARDAVERFNSPKSPARRLLATYDAAVGTVDLDTLAGELGRLAEHCDDAGRDDEATVLRTARDIAAGFAWSDRGDDRWAEA
jgi:hypothetical protein